MKQNSHNKSNLIAIYNKNNEKAINMWVRKRVEKNSKKTHKGVQNKKLFHPQLFSQGFSIIKLLKENSKNKHEKKKKSTTKKWKVEEKTIIVISARSGRGWKLIKLYSYLILWWGDLRKEVVNRQFVPAFSKNPLIIINSPSIDHLVQIL